jgi:methyl-accepting chemotaxis protein
MFNKLKIRAKLVLGFMLVALLATIIGLFAIQRIKKIDKSYTYMYEMATKPLAEMIKLTDAYQRLRVNIREMLIADNQEQYKNRLDKALTYNTTLDEILKNYEAVILDETDRKNYEALAKAKKGFWDIFPQYRTMIENNDIADAKAVLEKEWFTKPNSS